MRDYSRLEATAFARRDVAGLRVLVVGSGALGNEVLKNLALIGVGHIGIVDRDAVDATNLTRSVLFCTPDIGRHLQSRTKKAVLAAGRVSEINADVRTRAYVTEVADLGAGVIRQYDLVFSCLDNEMARLELGWLCTRLDKPLVDGGLGLINPAAGLVSLFPGAGGPCYACRKGAERRRELLQDLQGRADPCAVKERLQRANGIVATTPTMASIIGALQVEIGVRFLREGGDPVSGRLGQAVRITLAPGRVLDQMTFDRSPNCPLHEDDGVMDRVTERPDRVSATWTPAELLHESSDGDGVLQFDWPMTARATCAQCGYGWEPWMRRARFRGQCCPSCASLMVTEIEVVTSIGLASPWASRSLAALGLPAGHVHEVVVGSGDSSRRQHVEVTGDLTPFPEIAVR